MTENLNREIAISLTIAADMRQQARMTNERSDVGSKAQWVLRAQNWLGEARRLIALRQVEAQQAGA